MNLLGDLIGGFCERILNKIKCKVSGHEFHICHVRRIDENLVECVCLNCHEIQKAYCGLYLGKYIPLKACPKCMKMKSMGVI